MLYESGPINYTGVESEPPTGVKAGVASATKHVKAGAAGTAQTLRGSGV
jgi:hypothetical protein